jgi:hypothetical protein
MPLLPALALAALAALAWDEHDVNRIVRAYKPLRKHPELFDATAGWNRWIEPRLLRHRLPHCPRPLVRRCLLRPRLPHCPRIRHPVGSPRTGGSNRGSSTRSTSSGRATRAPCARLTLTLALALHLAQP